MYSDPIITKNNEKEYTFLFIPTTKGLLEFIIK